MTAFIPESFTTHLVESLEDNQQFALSVEEFPSHETYQFKGTYLGCRPVTNDDVEIVDRIRERWVKSLRPIFADLPVEVLQAFVMPAQVAIEFRVAEIYLQTPGPGAGGRLVPPAAV